MRALKGRLMTLNLTLAALQAEKNTPARVFMWRLKTSDQLHNIRQVRNTAAQSCYHFPQELYWLSHAEERKISTWTVVTAAMKPSFLLPLPHFSVLIRQQQVLRAGNGDINPQLCVTCLLCLFWTRRGLVSCFAAVVTVQLEIHRPCCLSHRLDLRLRRFLFIIRAARLLSALLE